MMEELLLNQDQEQDPLEGMLVDQEMLEQEMLEQDKVTLLLVQKMTKPAG